MLLQLIEDLVNDAHLSKRNLVNELLRGRVVAFAEACLQVLLSEHQLIDYGRLELHEVLRRAVSRLDQQLVTEAKLSLDLVRCVKCEQLTLSHDADAVCQFVGLLKMLRAHDDGATLLEHLDQCPHLLTRFYIETRSGLVKEDNLWSSHNSHRKRQLPLHTS